MLTYCYRLLHTSENIFDYFLIVVMSRLDALIARKNVLQPDDQG